MANFVLVHGAWHGAWCWRDVLPLLRQAGHRAHAVTLTGLGDRAHLLSPSIDLQTHIQDVTATIEAEELSEVVLVGHSYAGMLITAVADLIPEKLSHLVYVDAVVPKPGESWSSTHTAAVQRLRLTAANKDELFSFPPPDPHVFGLENSQYEWVRRRQTAHPGQTYQAPLEFNPETVANLPRTFISCTEPALATIDAIRPRVKSKDFWNGAWLPNSKFIEMQTGHDPMISDPQGLFEILNNCQ